MLTDEVMQRLKEILIEDEGIYLKKYKCSKGIDTIGVGFAKTFGFPDEIKEITRVNDFDKLEEINLNQAYDILEYQIKYFENKLLYRLDWYYGQSSSNKIVLISMAFNLGIKGLFRFKKMLKAMKNGDLQTSMNELLNSKYLNDVKSRALRLALILISQDVNIKKQECIYLYKVLKKRL